MSSCIFAKYFNIRIDNAYLFNKFLLPLYKALMSFLCTTCSTSIP